MDARETKNRNKCYVGAAVVCQLWHAGMINMSHTPAVFKVGICCLYGALVLFVAGFVSPYWVEEEYRAHENDVKDNELIGEDVNASFLAKENGSHFGVWQRCVVVHSESVCTIFTKDIDSVILMFGCVDGFILLGLCCWSCLSCVRKPRKGRYVVIVIAAIIGETYQACTQDFACAYGLSVGCEASAENQMWCAIFGLVSMFIFISAQGHKPYSWAFALFVASCLLELSAAAIFLWGVSRSPIRDSLASCAPEVMEDTDHAISHTVPGIVVTGATPKRKGKRRSVQVVLRPSKTRLRFTPDLEADAPLDLVTLDMVSPAPSTPLDKRCLDRRKKGGRVKRVHSRSTGRRQSKRGPVETLAKQVMEQQVAYIKVDCPASAAMPHHDTNPRLSSADTDQELVPPKYETATKADQYKRPDSLYIDLGSQPSQIPSVYNSSEGFQRPRTSSTGSRHLQQWCESSPLEGSTKHTARSFKRKSSGTPGIRVTIDIHQAPTSPTLPHILDSSDEDTACGHATHSPLRCGAVEQTSPSQPLLRPSLPSHKPQAAFPLADNDSPHEASPLAPEKHEQQVTWHGCGRVGSVRQEKESCDDGQYVQFSPDTYYRARSSLFSDSPSENNVYDSHHRLRSSFHSFKPNEDKL